MTFATPPVKLSFMINLDRTNFLVGKMQILSIIIAHGMDNYINPMVVPPPQVLTGKTQTNPAFASSNRLNGLVKGWICGL